MRIKTNIVIGLDIKDCIGVNADDAILFNIIAAGYEKTCYSGMYIEKLERIVAMSDCVINQQGNASFGTMSIVCEVTGIKYVEGEIITGCMIKNVSADAIFADTDIVSAFTKFVPKFESLTKGQIVPIRVGMTKYNQASNKISVNGTLYMPTRDFKIYSMELGANDRLVCDESIKRAQAENERAKIMQATNSEAWKFFTQLLYPYNKPNTSIGVIEQDLMTLINTTGVVKISRDPRIELSRPIVYVYGDDAVADRSLNGSQVLVKILEDYCIYVQMICEMIDIYGGDIAQSHKNLWLLYKKNKVD